MTRKLPASVLLGTPVVLVVVLAGLLGAQEGAQPRQDETEAQPGLEGKDKTGEYMPIRRTPEPEPGGGGKDRSGTGAAPSRVPPSRFGEVPMPEGWVETPPPPVGASTSQLEPSSPIPYSITSTRALTDADMAGQTAADLRMALNEIFARHGYGFHDPALRAHFNGQPWYRPMHSSQDRVMAELSSIERSNVALLRARIEGTPPPEVPGPPPAKVAPAPKDEGLIPGAVVLGGIAVLVLLAGLTAVLAIRRRRLRT